MRKRTLAAIAVVLLVCILGASRLDRLLIYQDEPAKVDLIVVLGGGRGDRVNKGLELYNQGFAPLILVTGFNSEVAEFRRLYVDLYKGFLRNNGVSEDRIYLDCLSKSTFEEAVNTCAFMEKKGLKSAIVISDPYHMRRVKYCFDKAADGKEIRFVYIPSDLKWFQGTWWRDERGLFLATDEMLKWVYYLWNY